MKKWECQSCGYIYSPKAGDKSKGNTKTPFVLLDEDWVCPVCGACKKSFKKI